MMFTTRVLKKSGYMTIDGKVLPYHVEKTVSVIFHEKAETWSCPGVLGPDVMMGWRDLRKKILRKLCTEAKMAVRRQYVIDMDRQQRDEKQTEQ